MVKTIKELYEQELKYWTKTNQKFFGVTPIHEELPFPELQAKLDEDCEKFWNCDNPCKLAVELNNGNLDHEADLRTPKSYKLKLNHISMCVDIYGEYKYTNKKTGEIYYKDTAIGAMPTPCDDLCWIINGTHYVTRITASREKRVAKKGNDGIIHGDGWKLYADKKQFVRVIYNKGTEEEIPITIDQMLDKDTPLISKRTRVLLKSILQEEVTKDNLIRGLMMLPAFEKDSIFVYRFQRLEYFFNVITSSGRYAKPTKRMLLGVNMTISSKKKHTYIDGETYDGCLVRSESKIFALENFRTCVNIYGVDSSTPARNEYLNHYSRNKYKNKKNDFQPAFTYSDTNGFFDSFKTVTSKSAGRQRLLLDNIVVNDGMLWLVDDDGVEHNMYEYVDFPPTERLSCLSKSPFCNNDKPKRIMMNAKMTSQAVPLKEEIDDITHRIIARVGFTDIKGYTTADSITISKSFAERLRTYGSDILYLNINSNLYTYGIKPAIENHNVIKFDQFEKLYPTKNKAILYSYENGKVDRVEVLDKQNVRVFISWEIPFRLGDKITNLHGAKGTVGLILPDDQMPCLKHKVGNMEPGPLEVIVSGFSTIKRESLGQIFEAWALASGIELDGKNDFAAIMMDKYGKQMKKYSDKSVVEYDGETQIIPVGFNYFMRLYHHASTKVSCSSADHGYTRTLRFGEMEKLNLIANDCPNILRELGIRSVVKYLGSHKLITELEETRQLPTNPKINMSFFEILRSIGYEIIHENEASDNDEELIDDNLVEYTDVSDDDDYYYYYEEEPLDDIDMANLNNRIRKGESDDDDTETIESETD